MIYPLIFATSTLICPWLFSWLLHFPAVIAQLICHPAWLLPCLWFAWASRRWASNRARTARVLLCVQLGLVFGGWQLETLGTQQLSRQWDNTDISAAVLITQLGRNDGASDQFEAEILKLDCRQNCPPLQHRLLRFTWYQAPPLALGQVWQLHFKLRQLSGFANPGGFDFQAHQLAAGLSGTGSVRRGQMISQQTPDWSGRLRNRLLNQLHQAEVGGVLYSRFYRALALGDTSAMDWQDWQVLQRTGTIHLMAISGFQVGLMAWLGFLLGSGIGRIWSTLCRSSGSWPMAFWPWCFAITLAWFYTALAQYAIPAQRALVAVIFINSSLALGWRPSLGAVLAWAAVWAVIAEPLVGLNTGFWLSYIAVLALLMGLGNRLGAKRWWREALSAQLIVTLALLLPLFILQLPFSLSSPLANIIIAPVISVIITPGVFVALGADLIDCSAAVLKLLDFAYGACWTGLEYLTQWRHSLLWPYRPLGWAEVLLGLVGTLAQLLPKGLNLRLLGILALSGVLLLPSRDKPPLQLTILDVGQGLAVAIATPHHHLLYDTGPAFSPQFDAGTSILLPYLIGRGVHRSDLILSRDHRDHSGGFRGLEANLDMPRLLTGEAVAHLPTAPRCLRGQQWQMDAVNIQVLWPPVISPDYGGNRSCVLLIRFGDDAILLSGDIDKTVEQQLLQENQLPTPIRLLVAPNHGSPSSSSRAFVEALKPQITVFSTARYNPYGQPNAKVTKLYQELGLNFMTTANAGSIELVWQTANREPILTRQRIDHPKLWQRW